MRALAVAALVLLMGGCLSNPEPAVVAKPAHAARLVLATQSPGRGQTLIRPVDPDTLADVPGLEPLDLAGCSTRLVTQPAGQLAAAVAGLSGSPRCGSAEPATLRVLDLNAWAWRPPLTLGSTTDAPLAWTADGHGVYVVTSTPPPEQRRLWLIDTTNSSAPISVPLDFVPARLDVAANDSAVFVLGGQTAGNSRAGAAVQGSAFVAIFDPKTLTERVRVPLSGLNLGLADQQQGSLTPGVAVAPDGSRYYVVHADRPVLDVVDTRAPRLERLERSISLRDAASQIATRRAWLGVSPDGSSLYAWHQAETPADDLGLQVIDTRKWHVQTVDPIAERLSVSLSGRWLFELDPPAWTRAGAAAPQQRGPRSLSGARLSILDATSQNEVATLMRDQFLLGAGQYGPDRLYLTEVTQRQGRGAQPSAVVAYDTATWHEIARRTFDMPGSLVTTSPLW